MSIRPKWLRDICSILFSGYYILYAHEGDEKVRNHKQPVFLFSDESRARVRVAKEI